MSYLLFLTILSVTTLMLLLGALSYTANTASGSFHGDHDDLHLSSGVGVGVGAWHPSTADHDDLRLSSGVGVGVGAWRPSTAHVLFSTDCQAWMSWQSYALFHSALSAGHQGHVTRIVSGCSEGEEEDMRKSFSDGEGKMSAKFHIHFTPTFDDLPANTTTFSSVYYGGNGVTKKYAYFNKPYGTLHFMENVVGTDGGGKVNGPDEVYALIDPDMFFLRPLYDEYPDDSPFRKPNHVGNLPFPDHPPGKVVTGKPVSQLYGFRGQWMNFDYSEVVGDAAHSLISSMSKTVALTRYPGGPPYIATAHDWLNVARRWAQYVKPTYFKKPSLMSEMYAWSLASASLSLPNYISTDHMISNTVMGESEGWRLIDELPEPVSSPRHLLDQSVPLPTFLHLCRTHRVGEFVIGKRRIRRDIMSCDSPLLQEPPLDLGEGYPYKTQGKDPQSGLPRPHVDLTPRQAKRAAFVVSSTIRIINDAAIHYKDNVCEGKANYDKVWKIDLT